MDLSSLYNGIKELGNIYQKLDNIEIQKKVLELSKEALDMQSEVLKLQEENSKLKKREKIESKIERHQDAYITLKDDEKKLIYCSNCWDSNQKLIQGQIDENGKYQCPACKYIRIL